MSVNLKVSFDGKDYVVGILKSKSSLSISMGFNFNLYVREIETDRTYVLDFSKDLCQLPKFDAYLRSDNNLRSCVISELENRDLIIPLGKEVDYNGDTYRLYQFSYNLLDLCDTR